MGEVNGRHPFTKEETEGRLGMLMEATLWGLPPHGVCNRAVCGGV